MKLVMNRNITISNTSGHCIAFKKGEPTHVPDGLVESAMARGAVPVEGETLPSVEEPKVAPTPIGLQRKELIISAFETMIAKNERDAFSGAGLPKVAALNAELDFKVDVKEMRDLWRDYKAAVSSDEDE